MSSATDEIKARIDLVELIGRSVPLRKSGSSFKGLCPFHSEKTPSFYVFPQSHTFVCFGCGKKGTAFDWLMEREHLEFGEALRSLAQIAGVELPTRRDPRQEETTRRLYDLLTRAQTYYQGLLQGAGGVAARRYLAGRGVAETTVLEFGLGYAPGGNGLLRYLKEAGFSEEEMAAAGVLSIAEDGHPFDFFRERVLFPIRDPQGRTIAFGGRALDDGTPKYLNSRDTLLFHKQETLFALDLARKPIGQERRAVIVEGYMDALMAHQHGYRNVVATLGTAVTERHLVLLRRVADEIVLALDSDAAGQAATWRALQVAEHGLRAGLTPVLGPTRRQRQYVADRGAELKVLTMPAAKDPDDFIRADPAGWATLVQSAKPVIDFVLDRLSDRHDLSSARGKDEAADEVAEILGGIPNPIEQAHYVQRAAQLLQVDEAAVRAALRGRAKSRRTRASAAPPDRSDVRQGEGGGPAQGAQTEVEEDRLDEYTLALLCQVRARGDAGVVTPTADDFALPQSRALYRAILSIPEGRPVDDVRQRLPDELQGHLDRVARFFPDVERVGASGAPREMETAILRMRRRALLARKSHIHTLVRDAASADEQGEWLTQLSLLAHELSEMESALSEVARKTQQVGAR